jgi:hypothetical protein
MFGNPAWPSLPEISSLGVRDYDASPPETSSESSGMSSDNYYSDLPDLEEIN